MANGKQLSQKATEFILDIMDTYCDAKEEVTSCVVIARNPVDDMHKLNKLIKMRAKQFLI